MQLSKRLSAVAGFVTPGNRLADVGTDHGYVPIYLVETKKIPSAIAMDINEGPLLRAQQHIRDAGLGEYIQTRRSDGADALRPGEADTLILAGMGGPLMERILTQGRLVLEDCREFILQPQSEIREFRKYLQMNGRRMESFIRYCGPYTAGWTGNGRSTSVSGSCCLSSAIRCSENFWNGSRG